MEKETPAVSDDNQYENSPFRSLIELNFISQFYTHSPLIDNIYSLFWQTQENTLAHNQSSYTYRETTLVDLF